MADHNLTLIYDVSNRNWYTAVAGTVVQPPVGLGQNQSVALTLKLVKSGVQYQPTGSLNWSRSGIKALNAITSGYLVTLGTPTLSGTGATAAYTFTFTVDSTELRAFILEYLPNYTQTNYALELFEATNSIATLPALGLTIYPDYTYTGTTPTSANGTLNVTATKTVTFPQSLTFPSALGTNGFQLSTDGAGALTWAASGALTDGDKGDITVSNSGAIFTIDNDVVGLAKLAHMATARVIGRTTPSNGSPELLTISGTGSVAMTNTPTLVTPVLGAATATSINGITITPSGAGTLTMDGSISTHGPSGGPIDTSSYGGYIDTHSNGGSINTSGFGGSIDTSNNGGTGGNINTSGYGVNVGGYINTSGSGANAGGYINTSGGGGNINTSGSGANAGGYINTSGGATGAGGSINTNNGGGGIYTDGGGGSITTYGTGTIELGTTGTRTTFTGSATSNIAIALPNFGGTVAVTSHSATTTHAMFSAGAAGYTTRAIASADIATALTTPGAIGGTTASTGAFTTVSLKGATSGVVTLAAPAIATTATLTFAPSASVTMTPPATSFTAARTDAAQTFTDVTDRNGTTAGSLILSGPGPALRLATTSGAGFFTVYTHPSNNNSYVGCPGSIVFTNSYNGAGTTTFSISSAGDASATSVTLPVTSSGSSLNLGNGRGIRGNTNYVEIMDGSIYMIALNSGGSILNCNLSPSVTNQRNLGTSGNRWSSVSSVLGDFSGLLTASGGIAGTLTSCTGLPVATGISGLGTGVATALAVATNAVGGFATKMYREWTCKEMIQYNSGDLSFSAIGSSTQQGAVFATNATNYLKIPLTDMRFAGRTVRLRIVCITDVTESANLQLFFEVDWRTTALDGATTQPVGVGYATGGGTAETVTKAAPATSLRILSIASTSTWAISSTATYISVAFGRKASTGDDPTNIDTSTANLGVWSLILEEI